MGSRGACISLILQVLTYVYFTYLLTCVRLYLLAYVLTYLLTYLGSERTSKSKVEGQGKKEATAINQSLTSLTGVFRGIAAKSSHISYRNSKLTRLLSKCFQNGGKTLVIVNVAPTLLSRYV